MADPNATFAESARELGQHLAGFTFVEGDGREFRSQSMADAAPSEGPGVNRGADLLVAAGSLTPNVAEALRQGARRRVDNGEFFGHISFQSIIGRKSEQ
jgi:hypothetical protein